ncbi:MAG: hypothetical protein H6711_16875 [Myxococcales bacterium]|nr:hypothetical protein [Myxococcales bacterium]
MKTIFSILALTALVAGCQVAPGSYTVVRVASADTVRSPSCYNNNVPDDIVNDSTTFYAGGTLGIFAADADNYFVDITTNNGPLTVDGTRDGGDYSFYGKAVDYEADVDGMGGARTTTYEADIRFTLKTHTVIGTAEFTTTCTGVNCGVDSCVETTDFIGTVVRDVELEHGI